MMMCFLFIVYGMFTGFWGRKWEALWNWVGCVRARRITELVIGFTAFILIGYALSIFWGALGTAIVASSK